MRIPVSQPSEFLHKIGSGHDVRITSLSWLPGTRVLTVSCDDIFSAFQETPESPGPLAVELVFSNVAHFDASIDSVDDYLSISRITCTQVGSGLETVFELWLQGTLHAVANEMLVEYDAEDEHRPAINKLLDILGRPEVSR